MLEPDTEDAQGDIISAEEIEKAAHGFLVKSCASREKPTRKWLKLMSWESYTAPGFHYQRPDGRWAAAMS